MMMHPSGGWGLLPLLMPVSMLVLGLIVLSVVRAAMSPPRLSRRQSGRREAAASDDDPLDVLRERYVRGEIDLDDLERQLGVLMRHEPSALPRRTG